MVDCADKRCQTPDGDQGVDFCVRTVRDDTDQVDCQVDGNPVTHEVVIENYRPNSLEVDIHAWSKDRKVKFSGRGAMCEWKESKKTIPKGQKGNATEVCCGESASPNIRTLDTDELVAEITYIDNLPLKIKPAPTARCEIDVDVN